MRKALREVAGAVEEKRKLEGGWDKEREKRDCTLELVLQPLFFYVINLLTSTVCRLRMLS